MSAKPRTVFIVSDGTGITAETFSQSILAQFELPFRQVRMPFIDTVDKAHQVVREINDYAKTSGLQPIVFTTLVDSEVNAVVSTQEVLQARELVRQVYMDEKVEQYILDIVFATRRPQEYRLEKLKPLIAYGGSPRASINLALAAKAQAFLNKRGYVIPEDIRSIAKDVMRHRVGLNYEAEAENIRVENVIDEIIQIIPVP